MLLLNTKKFLKNQQQTERLRPIFPFCTHFSAVKKNYRDFYVRSAEVIEIKLWSLALFLKKTRENAIRLLFFLLNS